MIVIEALGILSVVSLLLIGVLLIGSGVSDLMEVANQGDSSFEGRNYVDKKRARKAILLGVLSLWAVIVILLTI